VEYLANVLDVFSAIGRSILRKPLLSLGSQYLPMQIAQLRRNVKHQTYSHPSTDKKNLP